MNEWLNPASSSSHLVFQVVTLPLVTLLFLRCVYRVIRRSRSRVGSFAGALIWFAAGIAILRPGVTNELARLLGIGRGADLLLYLLAIAFLTSAFYFYQKFHRLESDLTRVVRRLAVQEGLKRWPPEERDEEGQNGNEPGITNRD
jgi:hypothetical protein